MRQAWGCNKPQPGTQLEGQIFTVCLFFALCSVFSFSFSDMTQLNTATLLHTAVLHILREDCVHCGVRLVIDLCKQSKSTLECVQQQHAGQH